MSPERTEHSAPSRVSYLSMRQRATLAESTLAESTRWSSAVCSTWTASWIWRSRI